MEAVLTIDTSGEWWVGTEANDIREFLIAYEAEGYPVHETRVCTCGCGSVSFKFSADRDEGCAQRICVSCGAAHFIGDSEEYWEEAEPEAWQCGCGSKTCNVGVGYALRKADLGKQPDVRWISIGNRCTNCGTLGSFVDWKIDYGPSYHLLDRA